MTAEWIKDDNANTDKWRKKANHSEECYISQYPDISDYYWATIRNDHRLCGIKHDREDAMRAADDALAMPIDKFNDLVAAELLEDLKRIEKKILTLQPSTTLLPGYQTGFQDGVADTKRKIDEALKA